MYDLIAAAALLIDVQPPPAQGANREPIAVDISPHFVGSFLAKRTETFRCPGFEVTVETQRLHKPDFITDNILAIYVNDSKLSEEEMLEINKQIAELPWTAKIYPECSRSGVRLRLVCDGGQPAGESRLIQLNRR
jgi:hypothetical protein